MTDPECGCPLQIICSVVGWNKDNPACGCFSFEQPYEAASLNLEKYANPCSAQKLILSLMLWLLLLFRKNAVPKSVRFLTWRQYIVSVKI